MTTNPNPYAPPSALTSGRPSSGVVDVGSVVSTCVRRSWLGRTIQLSGGLDAAIRYSALGNGEKVFVDDALVAKSSPLYLSLVAPRIDFKISVGETTIPATVEVYAAWLQLFRVVRSSLIVGGQLVYAEPDGG